MVSNLYGVSDATFREYPPVMCVALSQYKIAYDSLRAVLHNLQVDPRPLNSQKQTMKRLRRRYRESKKTAQRQVALEMRRRGIPLTVPTPYTASEADVAPEF